MGKPSVIRRVMYIVYSNKREVFFFFLGNYRRITYVLFSVTNGTEWSRTYES